MNERSTGRGRFGSKTLDLPDSAPEPDLQGGRIPAMGTGWPRILTVGHAEACAAFMCSVLGGLPSHVDVDATLDLAAARSRLARWHYDLVALLLPLPGADAVAACRNLRTVAGRVLILVLDGESTIDRAVAAFEAGADTYLLGPVQPDELRARLAALLRLQVDALGPAPSGVGDRTRPAAHLPGRRSTGKTGAPAPEREGQAPLLRGGWRG